MLYIGIDQSYTSTGYCVLNGDEIVEFGTIKTNADDSIHRRAGESGSAIVDLINRYPESKASIEGLAFGMRGSATRDLAGLQFVILDRIYNNTHIDEVHIITPKTIKKFATGNGGSAKKKVTKKDMFNSLPLDVQNLFKTKYKSSSGLYDITDAYYLAKVSQSTQE
jgi:Holliday junction resolvasome RuvABC endonuclease subunit